MKRRFCTFSSPALLQPHCGLGSQPPPPAPFGRYDRFRASAGTAACWLGVGAGLPPLGRYSGVKVEVSSPAAARRHTHTRPAHPTALPALRPPRPPIRRNQTGPSGAPLSRHRCGALRNWEQRRGRCANVHLEAGTQDTHSWRAGHPPRQARTRRRRRAACRTQGDSSVAIALICTFVELRSPACAAHMGCGWAGQQAQPSP